VAGKVHKKLWQVCNRWRNQAAVQAALVCTTREELMRSQDALRVTRAELERIRARNEELERRQGR